MPAHGKALSDVSVYNKVWSQLSAVLPVSDATAAFFAYTDFVLSAEVGAEAPEELLSGVGAEA